MKIKVGDIVSSVSKTHSFNTDDVIALNTSDILRGKIVNTPRIKVSDLKGQFKKTIQKNDILFSEIRPKNKRFALVATEDTEDFAVSTKIMVLRLINKDVNLKYFYYWLTSDAFTSILQHRAENRIGSFPQITFDLLSDYSLEIPGTEEQQRTVDVLTLIDDKLAINDRMNSDLEQTARLMYDYWFTQFDFPDVNSRPYKSSGGAMVYNDRLKREIPGGWSEKKLNDIFEFEKGSEPGAIAYSDKKNSDSHIKFYRVGDIETESKTFVDSANYTLKIVKPGDIVVTFDGTVGKMGLALDGAISGGLRHIYDKSMVFSSSVVWSIFGDKKIQATIHKYATGSVLLHASSSIDHLVIAYNKETLKKYQEKIIPLYNQIVLNDQESTELAKLRDWLLPMLMTGRVKVK